MTSQGGGGGGGLTRPYFRDSRKIGLHHLYALEDKCPSVQIHITSLSDFIDIVNYVIAYMKLDCDASLDLYAEVTPGTI